MNMDALWDANKVSSFPSMLQVLTGAVQARVTAVAIEPRGYADQGSFIW